MRFRRAQDSVLDAADALYALVTGGERREAYVGAMLVAEHIANVRALRRGLLSVRRK